MRRIIYVPALEGMLAWLIPKVSTSHSSSHFQKSKNIKSSWKRKGTGLNLPIRHSTKIRESSEKLQENNRRSGRLLSTSESQGKLQKVLVICWGESGASLTYRCCACRMQKVTGGIGGTKTSPHRSGIPKD